MWGTRSHPQLWILLDEVFTMTSRHFEVVTSIKLLLVSTCYYMLDHVSTTEFSVIQVVVNHNTKLPWPGTARIWRPAALGWRFAVLC